MSTHALSRGKRYALFLLAGACLAIILPVAGRFFDVVPAVQAQATAQKPLEKPPEGQTFMGAKNCSSCHLDQFLDWRETKHAKGFEILPAKYREDASCLKCHTTGFGEATGFKTMATTPQLAGASCESCHGPGSKHGEIAKSFGQKKLSKDEELYVRSTIHRMQPKNVCVDCHLTRAHKKHPPFQK
jgi:hypothetical protein